MTELSYALLYDTAITTLRIPSSVTMIDEYALSQYMETIIFPDNFNFSNFIIQSPQFLSDTVQFKVEVDSVYTYQKKYQNIQFTINETTYQLGYIIKQNQVCLLKDTHIQTDQGLVKVQELSKHNTIGGQHVLGYSCGYYLGKQIVKIEKDAFGLNLPNQDLFVTPLHSIYLNQKLTIAFRLVPKVEKMYFVPYDKLMGRVYNPILENWSIIKANNLPVESLHPNYPKVEKHSCIIFKNNTIDDNIRKEIKLLSEQSKLINII